MIFYTRLLWKYRLLSVLPIVQGDVAIYTHLLYRPDSYCTERCSSKEPTRLIFSNMKLPKNVMKIIIIIQKKKADLLVLWKYFFVFWFRLFFCRFFRVMAKNLIWILNFIFPFDFYFSFQIAYSLNY